MDRREIAAARCYVLGQATSTLPQLYATLGAEGDVGMPQANKFMEQYSSWQMVPESRNPSCHVYRVCLGGFFTGYSMCQAMML